MPERDVEYELFYVEVTDPERYLEAVEAVDSIRAYDASVIDEHSLYLYVCQETREEDLRFRRAFSALDLLVVPPVVYDGTASARMTILGAGESLQTLLENLPAEIDHAVHEIGEYDRRHGVLTNGLTDRQLEAVVVAVDCGYYDVPRSGTLEEVAKRLECAPSTASNHLRKAETSVMRRIAARRGTPL